MSGRKPAMKLRAASLGGLWFALIAAGGVARAQAELPVPSDDWRRVDHSMQLLGDFNGDGLADAVRVLRQGGQSKAVIWVTLGGMHGVVRHFPIADLAPDQAATTRFSYSAPENGSRAVGIIILQPDGKRQSVRWRENRFIMAMAPAG